MKTRQRGAPGKAMWIALPLALPMILLLDRPAIGADPRIRELAYDPASVVTVATKPGVTTLVQFAPEEHVRSIAAGQGANCGQWSDPWCVTWPSNAGFVFVHPKSRANQALALAVVTDRRVYSLVFEPLAVRDARQAIYRLRFTYPAAPPSSSSPSLNSSALAAQGTLVAERNNTGAASVANAAAQALPVNANYTIAYGRDSVDLRPALVFDDGRFTYLKWSGNREIPAVFEIRADGSEMVANTRMQGDLLVVDRIARGLMLRSGSAVASIHNEAFEPEGHAPIDGTTALGLARILKE